MLVMNPLILSELIRASMGTCSFPRVQAALGLSGYLYSLAVFFFLFAFLACTLLQHHNYNAVRSELLIRAGLISAFYRKTMRLTPEARSKLGTGMCEMTAALSGSHVMRGKSMRAQQVF